MFGKNLSAYRINAHIAKLKKRTKPHWKSLPSQVVQDVVLRSVRQWTCPECGSNHDRDVNAALNIKRAGLAA